uniref:Sorting nexin C-terminal domain-containing protein n=1 Tax=Brassica oleracea TaxID=3712 RepID=A0A3P6AUT1_BRAOL|nr:unnamed protein product [Brassica oleracea]
MRPNVIEVIMNLADKVFQLSRGGLLRKKTFTAWKKLILLMREAVDDWFLKKIHRLRNEDTVAHGIRWFQDILWPNGVFFTRVDDSEEALDQTDPNGRPTWLELVNLRNSFSRTPPTTLVNFARENLYRTCPSDILYFTQSNVCIKQLVFAILELLLLNVFPERQDLFRDTRKNPTHGPSE